MDLPQEIFYKKCFENLKKEIDFCYGALFYKNGGRYFLNYDISFSLDFDKYITHLYDKSKDFFRLKIPVNTQSGAIGYFLLVRKTPFARIERDKTKKISELYGEKIKEFELSKIFKTQLFILQDAILKKNYAAKQLSKENKRLIETDKIRTEFLANVSHELRTPLNSIIGFSTVLKDEMLGALNIRQKDCANKILSSAIHLTGLINDILDMTKIESGAMQANLRPLRPNEIIKEVINTIEPLAAEKGIKIETKLCFNSKIPLDDRKFRQVICNLAGNAVKFSHQDSKIIISTEKTGSSVYIKVKDFGIGIPKKEQERIFDKFAQLDNIYTKKYPSTGLGLTITREFLKMQNGKIKVNSVPGKGSEFVVEFSIS